MKTNIKALVAAVSAISVAAAPAVAHADEVYFLVGSRHVYRVGHSPYINVSQRQGIEQQYGDAVAAAQTAFNQSVQNGDDPAHASDVLNQRLADAAAARDDQLAQYFTPDDAILARHPEMAIQGDGPYQVIGININNHVWANYTVYAPWPGYVVVGHPYGWIYGRPYDPYAFHQAYVGWYGGWVSAGAPLFVGLYGHSGFINIGFSASINLGLRSRGFEPGPGFRAGADWHSGFRPSLTPGGRPTGNFTARPGGFAPRAGGFANRPAGTARGSFGARTGAAPARSFGSRPMARPGGSFGGRPSATAPRGSFGARPMATPRSSFGGRSAPAPRGSFGSRPAAAPRSFSGASHMSSGHSGGSSHSDHHGHG